MKIEENESLMLKFLAELCLACEPITIDDSSVSVEPSNGFTLNLDPLVDIAALPRLRTLRSHKPHGLENLGVVSLLRKRVESGLRVIEEECVSVGMASGVEGLSELWCALVCLQYTRYRLTTHSCPN